VPQHFITQLAGTAMMISGIVYLSLAFASPFMPVPRGIKAATIVAMISACIANTFLGLIIFNATPRQDYSWFEWFTVAAITAKAVTLNILAGMTYAWMYLQKRNRRRGRRTL
jgi:hypothetical protein